MGKKASSKRRKREQPLFVVFGLAKNGKAKGACFISEQIELALDAAMMPGMSVFEAVSAEMQLLAKKLPSGRNYKIRRPSLPYITVELYKLLHAASGGLVRDRGSKSSS